MIELRWMVAEWEEYRDGLQTGVIHKDEPVLQYRIQGENREPVWITVPTEVIEE